MDLGARLVAAWTATGTTVCDLARHRLPIPVLGLTYDDTVWRQLNLLFGVLPIRVDPMDNPKDMISTLDEIVLQRELAAHGDFILVVMSTQPTTPGATDVTLVHRVGSSNALE
jgi:pyruvate kinase